MTSVGAGVGAAGGGAGVELGSEALSPEEVEGPGMAGVEADEDVDFGSDFGSDLALVEFFRETGSIFFGAYFIRCSGGSLKVTIFDFFGVLPTRSCDEEVEADDGVDMTKVPVAESRR